MIELWIHPSFEWHKLKMIKGAGDDDDDDDEWAGERGREGKLGQESPVT